MCLTWQAVAEKEKEEAMQHQMRTQHNKQQLALYHAAQAGMRAEMQAVVDAKAKAEAIQVCLNMLQQQH